MEEKTGTRPTRNQGCLLCYHGLAWRIRSLSESDGSSLFRGGLMSTEASLDVGVPKGSTPSGDGTAWSLASLWLGAVALLSAPMMMIYLLLAWKPPMRWRLPSSQCSRPS